MALRKDRIEGNRISIGLSTELLDRTYPTIDENLACDQALWEECEAGRRGAVLRLWRVSDPFVVVGYGASVEQEVYLERCREREIPVRRRITGGGTVVQVPGSLNFALVTPCQGLTAAQTLSRHWLLQLAQAFAAHCPTLKLDGYGDLAIDGRKCSGSAQRAGREWLLLHGTLLTALDLDLIETLLPMPRRTPAYRAERTHRHFLTRLPLNEERARQTVIQAFSAMTPASPPDPGAMQRLVARYQSSDWIFRRSGTAPPTKQPPGS